MQRTCALKVTKVGGHIAHSHGTCHCGVWRVEGQGMHKGWLAGAANCTPTLLHHLHHQLQMVLNYMSWAELGFCSADVTKELLSRFRLPTAKG